MNFPESSTEENLENKKDQKNPQEVTEGNEVEFLSRSGFAKGFLSIFGMAFGAGIIAAVLSAIHPILGGAVLIMLIIPLNIKHFSNCYLRANDIFGKKTPVNLFAVFVVLSFIPYLNILALGGIGYLLFKEGVFSNGAQAVSTIATDGIQEKSENLFSNLTASPSKATQVVPIDAGSIESLFELKEKGAISEEEYQTAKDKILKSAA
jgi:hypothetical protein